jgi:hypothetical protein
MLSVSYPSPPLPPSIAQVSKQPLIEATIITELAPIITNTIRSTTLKLQQKNSNSTTKKTAKISPKMASFLQQPRPQKLWLPQEDTLLISLMHLNPHGLRFRGSESWASIALTMTKQAPGHGIFHQSPRGAYTEANV